MYIHLFYLHFCWNTLYKKYELDYRKILNEPSPSPEIITRLLNRRNKAHEKSRQSANDSTKANRRAKTSFHNTVNDTLRNPSISAKKKFSILLKLMKNNKFSNILLWLKMIVPFMIKYIRVTFSINIFHPKQFYKILMTQYQI